MSRIPASPGLHIVPLDESPFVGPLARQAKQELDEQKVKGEGIVRQGEVPDLRKASRMALKSRGRMAPSDRPYQSLASIRPHLRYEPVSVKGTILENVRLVEATTGGGLLDGRWTGVSRA